MNKKDSKFEQILVIVGVILFLIAALSLISSHTILFLIRRSIITEHLVLYKKWQLTLLLISCGATVISSLILMFGVLKNNEEEDYQKYRNYVFVSKDEIKAYKTEIRKLKRKLHQNPNSK